MTLPGLVRANNLNDVVDRERAWDNLGSSLATGDIAIPAPSLDLNFAANKSLVDDISGNNLITFSRASTGTFVGSNGFIQTAASGVPRFDHNPTTGESLGLLVEEARTNLFMNSIDFLEPGPSVDHRWSKYGTSIVANTAIAPDGTLTASKIVATATTEQHRIGRVKGSVSPAWSSIFLKAAEYTICDLYDLNIDTGFRIDLTTGALSESPAFVGKFRANQYGVNAIGNGWYRVLIGRSSSDGTINNQLSIYPNGAQNYTGNGTSGILAWGAQLEAGTFATSFIPTASTTVTRAADVASITGANFSSWYRNSSSTFALRGKIVSPPIAFNTFGILAVSIAGSHADNNYRMRIVGTQFAAKRFDNAVNFELNLPGSLTAGSVYNYAVGYDDTGHAASSPLGFNSTTYPALPFQTATVLKLVPDAYGASHVISRLTYWPSRFYDQALQYITQPSITTINLYAFNYAINGKDVLALNAVRNASTRNFIFIKGLLSAAQPRLTTAAASTSSALALATNALPKLAPTSSGNYFFASGLTLSGITTRINGTNALSIATSPFSGSTATAPLLFRELRPQANWRFTEPMPSGTIASPEFAIPFETNDFVLFMKAGQN